MQKVLKVGNSLGVTLPSEVVYTLSIKAGDHVELVQDTDNSVRIVFPDSNQLSLGITSKEAKKQL